MLEDEVIPEGVPSQFGDRSVILVAVLPPVREDQIGSDFATQSVEQGLDLGEGFGA